MISTGSMKNEGTSRFMCRIASPSVPDFDLTRTIIDTAREMQPELKGKGFSTGSLHRMTHSTEKLRSGSKSCPPMAV